MATTEIYRYLSLKKHKVALDTEGYLITLSDWTPDVARVLATEAGITLTDEHWEILHVLRDFYQRFEQAPAMRPLVKAVARALGDEKGRSIYLMRLFPGSPAKLAARIAGLPKPTHCL